MRKPGLAPIRKAVERLGAAVPGYRPGTSLPAAQAPFSAVPDGGNVRHGASAPLRRTLRVSTAEGVFAEIVTACTGGAILTAWALYLGCGPLMVGLLAALPFLGQFVQLPAAWLSSTFGARRVCIVSVGLSRQALVPLVALPFLSLSSEAKQSVLLAVTAASALLGVIGNNAWTSWMGDLVPHRIRGRYFGTRTALCTLGGTLATLTAGLVLDWGKHHALVGGMLSTLAVASCLAGAATTWLMCQQQDAAEQAPLSLSARAVFQPLLDPHTRRYVGYQIAWNAAVGLSAPFFVLHMMQNLKMSFALIALYTAAAAGVRVVIGPLWGRAMDRVGARPVLIASSFGIGFVPIFWLFAGPDFLWPLLLEVVFAATLWSGHALAAFHLPLKVSPRQGRSYYLAIFAMAGGLAFAASTILGGAIVQQLPAQFELFGRTWFGLHVLFVASAIARLSCVFFALRIVERGARPVEALAQLVRTRATELGGRLTAPIIRR